MKALITTIAGFVVFLGGVFLAFGLPATLMIAGVTTAAFGLVWESE